MIRFCVLYVFIHTILFSFAEEACRSSCRCNDTIGWKVSQVKGLINLRRQECIDKNLKEIPNPIHNSIEILQLNNNSIKILEVIINFRLFNFTRYYDLDSESHDKN